MSKTKNKIIPTTGKNGSGDKVADEWCYKMEMEANEKMKRHKVFNLKNICAA